MFGYYSEIFPVSYNNDFSRSAEKSHTNVKVFLKSTFTIPLDFIQRVSLYHLAMCTFIMQVDWSFK